MEQSKEGDAIDRYFGQKPISSKKMQVVEMPLGEQKYPVLVGKLKDRDGLIVQADSRYVEIPKENLKDTILALIACLPGGLME